MISAIDVPAAFTSATPPLTRPTDSCINSRISFDADDER